MRVYLDNEDFSDEYIHAKGHLKGLLEDIYETGNVEDIEFHLDEVCDFFELGVPRTKPVVCKERTLKEIETERMLQNWVGYTRAYAEMMCSATQKES